ncbi:MAG: Uma2 family endonuclease [Cyanobacteria bacterium P01_H01_bin.121]
MTYTPAPPQEAVSIYPESDGQPMVENSKQYRWVVRLCENLKRLYQGQNVCVQADMFWYPVEGQPKIVNAPDVFVAIGRPAGDRSSYLQWQEDNIPPQVVFEIVSPGNTVQELQKKQEFYVQYGVLEILSYNPETYDFSGFIRESSEQLPSVLMRLNLPWTSPVMGIRFEMTATGLEVYYPNGDRFLDFQELFQAREAVEQERDRLAAKLRELGIDPGAI